MLAFSCRSFETWSNFLSKQRLCLASDLGTFVSLITLGQKMSLLSSQEMRCKNAEWAAPTKEWDQIWKYQSWKMESELSLVILPLPILGGYRYGSDLEFRIFFYIVCRAWASSFSAFSSALSASCCSFPKSSTMVSNMAMTLEPKLPLRELPNVPGHFWRRGFFLAERGWILALVEAFHNGFRLLHYFQGKTPISCRGLVGILFFATNL